MHVLGISGRLDHGAAAIAVDGQVVAAVTEASIARVANVGYAHTLGLPFGAVRACLRHANLTASDLDLIMVEGAAESEMDATRARWATQTAEPAFQAIAERRHLAVDPLTARAAQALPVAGQAHSRIAVVDLGGSGHGGVYQVDGGRLAHVAGIGGISELSGAVSDIARALGGSVEAMYAAAEGGRPDYVPALREAIAYRAGTIEVAADAIAGTIDRAGGDAPGPLSDVAPLHVKVREVRAGLAASLVARLAELAGDIVAHAGNGEGVIACGSLFESATVVAAVQRRVGALRVAPVPGPFGLALGAALAGSGPVATGLPAGLAVGPSFSEPDVKEVLDGCRLDYVYEPDWSRIDARISRMLSRGKLVAWFQGPMDFGPRSLGGRSILADASNRYARENINRYLRHKPDDQPPPLVMLASRTAECLADRVASPMAPVRVKVKDDWRLRLQAAVDGAGMCRVHTVESGPNRLAELLTAHEALTGVPALVHVDLRGLQEPTACSPRDAIRTTFSSPVDALVIERFLLMKDYWLLRSATE